MLGKDIGDLESVSNGLNSIEPSSMNGEGSMMYSSDADEVVESGSLAVVEQEVVEILPQGGSGSQQEEATSEAADLSEGAAKVEILGSKNEDATKVIAPTVGETNLSRATDGVVNETEELQSGDQQQTVAKPAETVEGQSFTLESATSDNPAELQGISENTDVAHSNVIQEAGEGSVITKAQPVEPSINSNNLGNGNDENKDVSVEISLNKQIHVTFETPKAEEQKKDEALTATSGVGVCSTLKQSQDGVNDGPAPAKVESVKTKTQSPPVVPSKFVYTKGGNEFTRYFTIIDSNKIEELGIAAYKEISVRDCESRNLTDSGITYGLNENNIIDIVRKSPEKFLMLMGDNQDEVLDIMHKVNALNEQSAAAVNDGPAPAQVESIETKTQSPPVVPSTFVYTKGGNEFTRYFTIIDSNKIEELGIAAYKEIDVVECESADYTDTRMTFGSNENDIIDIVRKSPEKFLMLIGNNQDEVLDIMHKVNALNEQSAAAAGVVTVALDDKITPNPELSSGVPGNVDASSNLPAPILKRGKLATAMIAVILVTGIVGAVGALLLSYLSTLQALGINLLTNVLRDYYLASVCVIASLVGVFAVSVICGITAILRTSPDRVKNKVVVQGDASKTEIEKAEGGTSLVRGSREQNNRVIAVAFFVIAAIELVTGCASVVLAYTERETPGFSDVDLCFMICGIALIIFSVLCACAAVAVCRKPVEIKKGDSATKIEETQVDHEKVQTEVVTSENEETSVMRSYDDECRKDDVAGVAGGAGLAANANSPSVEQDYDQNQPAKKPSVILSNTDEEGKGCCLGFWSACASSSESYGRAYGSRHVSLASAC